MKFGTLLGMGFAGVVIVAILNIGIIAFAIWVVLKLLQHFGVI